MFDKELADVIKSKIETEKFSYQMYEDLYGVAKEGEAISYLKWLSERIEFVMTSGSVPDVDVERLFELHKKVLLAGAKEDFEMYLLYVEWNRERSKSFYPPRRKALKPIVDALQELHDSDLELVCISMPPGTGKSSIAIFYLTWIAGKYPNEPSLVGSHSNNFIRGMYDECLRVFDPNGEYLWKDVFAGVNVTRTNAKDCRIDLDRPQRFETLEFTSIGTGNAGLYRAKRLLYCDDLVSGLEVALSEERLQKLWDTYTTDLRQRMIGDHCKQLMIATRWSVRDPIGRLQTMYGDSDKAKFLAYPAVDKDDKSNFDYPYGVGFSTEFYHQQRDIMDDVSWRALYMNEPIERSGLLYPKDELRRYFGLPDIEPDSVFAVCDTKDKGKDYCVMPIIYQYGQDFYVEEIICDNSTPEIVEPRLVNALMKHKVKLARFESNSAGGRIAKEVQDMLKEKNGMTKITTKFNTANKETRIISASGMIKEHFLFKDDTEAGKEYKSAIDQMCSYTMAGKNAHDDVPDAMSMAVDFAENMSLAKIEVFKRPF